MLIAVRADFYGRCAEHRGLADALHDANLLVGPMSPTELREAVVKPAAAAGLTVERALTTRISSCWFGWSLLVVRARSTVSPAAWPA